MRKLIIFCLLIILFGCSSNEEVEQPKEIIIENIESSSVDNVYYYNYLTAEQKAYYDMLLEASNNYSNTVEGKIAFNADDFRTAMNAFSLDYPLYYWWRTGIDAEYTSNSFKATTKEENIEDNVNKLINRKDEILNSCKDENNYKYIKNIHDYLVSNISYVTDCEHIHDMFGSLINGKSVCDGYSLAFKYLLNEAGFNCIVVEGKGLEDNGLVDHGWNYIELNGKWYLVDVTWDDTVYADSENDLAYDYFLLSDEMMSLDHIKNDIYEYPKCNDDSLFYVNMSGKYIKVYDENELPSLIAQWLTTGSNDIYLKFSNYDDGVKAYKYLLEEGNFEKIYSKCSKENYSITYGGEYNNASHVLHVYYETKN